MKLRGLGQVNIPSLSDLQKQVSAQFDRAVVTPAERVAQFALIGGVSAAAVGAIAGLTMRRKPARSTGALFALLAVPVVGTLAGVYYAARTPT